MTRIRPCMRCGKPCVWESTGLKPPTCTHCEARYDTQLDLVLAFILGAVFISDLVWLALS